MKTNIINSSIQLENEFLDYFDDQDYKSRDDELQQLLDNVNQVMFDNKIQKSLSTLSIFLEHAENSVSSLDVMKNTQPDYSELIKELPWVYEFYASALELKTSKQLIPYYKEINKLIIKKSHDNINDFLYYAEPKYMSDVLLVGLLRLTYSKKDQLNYWPVLKHQVEFELSERGLISEDYLKGLD